MSAAGHSHRLDGISATSGLPPWRDIGWTDRQVRKCHKLIQSRGLKLSRLLNAFAVN